VGEGHAQAPLNGDTELATTSLGSFQKPQAGENQIYLQLLTKPHKFKPLISQNHRMFGVGRDLCGSPSPTPLPKQGHPEQAAQDCVQVGFEYLQRRRLHSLPGQPVPGLRHPQMKKFFLGFIWNFLCFSLCPLPLVLSLGTTGKSLALSP